MSTEKLQRTLQGVVTSNKMEKSATVTIERRVKQARKCQMTKCPYKMREHDEANHCGIGDTVLIEQCRPISKNKSWKLVKVVEKATTV